MSNDETKLSRTPDRPTANECEEKGLGDHGRCVCMGGGLAVPGSAQDAQGVKTSMRKLE